MLGERRLREDGGGLPVRDDASRREEEHAVGVLGGQRQVVHRGEGRQALRRTEPSRSSSACC